MGRWWSAHSTCSCACRWAFTRRTSPPPSPPTTCCPSVGARSWNPILPSALAVAYAGVEHFLRIASCRESLQPAGPHQFHRDSDLHFAGSVLTVALSPRCRFTHASPTLFNAGTPRPQLSSCFLICAKNDSIEVLHLSGWLLLMQSSCSGICAPGCASASGTNDAHLPRCDDILVSLGRLGSCASEHCCRASMTR